MYRFRDIVKLNLDNEKHRLYIRAMGTTFAAMPFKTWSVEEIEELIELAESRGLNRRALARDYIGCHESLLSLLASGKREVRDLHRAALSYAEMKVKRKPGK